MTRRRTLPLLLIVLSFSGLAAGGDTEESHWAFRPVVRPKVPTAGAGWARTAIDSFIVARLEQAGLKPSPEAGRATLIRRLTFDLLGLPPTPQEIADFVGDNRPDAYERLVERLLASPHYGERWARHWLDVVRFAESDGFETNQPRPNAWHYRDWVIQAFNADLPFDQFVLEQLAGDVLGADAATGFLVGGPVDRVKSPDVVLTLQQRADELHDMVSTTGTAFLGLTVGCARCHNHKFDPISQKDYYGLTAVFAGVQHGERPLKGIDLAGRKKVADELRRQLARVEDELAVLEPLARPGVTMPLRDPVSPLLNVERFAPVEAKFVRFTVHETNGLEPCLDELEVFTAGPEPVNVALASLGTRATASGTYPGSDLHKLEHVNDGRYGNPRSWISNQTGKGWVQLEFPGPRRIDRIAWGRDREGKYQDRLPTRYTIEVALRPGEWQVVATAEDRAPPGAKAADLPARPGLTAAQRQAFEALAAKKRSLQERIKEFAAVPMAYAGTFAAPGPTHRLHRGDPMQKREEIAPAAPAALGPKLRLPASAAEPERRLALARWIVDPANPLTARVIVNRLWQHHFGEGIVATPSDFGLNGARPSHPELLDWLAAELVEHGWRLKHIHRLIVTSATYRQSAVANPEGLAADAGSRLLWRFPPRRLEAEVIRDAMLAVGGNLDLRMGGPGFDLFEPNTNYVKVYTPKKTFGRAEWRRMIYQSKPRMQLDDVFGAFDCPDGGQIAPKRNRSTTALQALNLLNSPFTQQQAEFLAGRLRREAGDDPGAQARHGMLLALGREPAPAECAAAAGLIRGHGLTAFCRALFNASEFIFVD
jgi:hypothetical protein